MTKGKRKPQQSDHRPPSRASTTGKPPSTLKPPPTSKTLPKTLNTTPIQQKLSFSPNAVPTTLTTPQGVIPHEVSPANDPANTTHDHPQPSSENVSAHTLAPIAAPNKTVQKPGVTDDNANAFTGDTPVRAIRTSLRYKITIEVKESSKPTFEFVKNFKEVFTIIQDITGPNLHIGPWDEEQESTEFPVITHPNKFPSGKEKNPLYIYTGSYINPKREGSKVWIQLRFVHELPIKLELHKLGEMLQDAFSDLPFDVRFNRQPMHCQATKSECIGWLYGSTKSISEETFTPAVRKALQIPDKVAFGLQWRVITNKFGKRPAFDQDHPPPSALHIDIDHRFVHTIQKRASELWRKSAKQKDRQPLPNDIQLRLVPCFSSTLSAARKTSKTEENVILMAEKQLFFVTKCINKIDIPFVRLLDTPLSNANDITLRRAIMSRSPSHEPTKRLIHNVDFIWNDTRRVQATTISKYLSATHEFISSMIPEMVFKYGPECQKWFSEDGLSYFENVIWDPTKLSTTSTTDQHTQDLVDEDLWDLGDEWKTPAERTPPTKAGTSILKQKTSIKEKNKVTVRQLETDDDIRSFASAFGNEPSESSPTGEDTGQTNNDATVTLSKQVLARMAQATPNRNSDNCSMSTAARTTDSTRLKLQVARTTIEDQTTTLTAQNATLLQQAQEIERLRQMLSGHPQRSPEHEIIFDVDSPNLDQPPDLVVLDDTAPTPTEAIIDVSSIDFPAELPPLPDSPQSEPSYESPAASQTSPYTEAPTEIYGQHITETTARPRDGFSNQTEEAYKESTYRHQSTVANLYSKFSAAKISSKGDLTTDKSPPKKVRFTSQEDDGACMSESSGTDDELRPSTGYQDHLLPTSSTDAVVDLLDDGRGAN